MALSMIGAKAKKSLIYGRFLQVLIERTFVARPLQ
jgi:hypothetical protein